MTRGSPLVMVPVLSSATIWVLACGFQRGGSFEQDAVFGAHAVAHHDGHRRCQTQRTGAADDQHRDAPGQRIAEALGPAAARQGWSATAMEMTAGTKTPDTLSAILAMGALVAAASLTIWMIWDRVVSSPTRVASQFREAGLVDGGGGDLVARSLVHRDALAGQGGFIHGAGTFQHNAVHRDVLTGAHHKEVALLHLFNGDSHFLRRPAAGWRSWGPASSGS